MRITIYLLSIVTANVTAAKFAPLDLGIFIIPWGTFFIGLTLVMRDMVQNSYGKKKTYLFIAIALALSALSSHLLGDELWIVFASVVSFLISETTDTEIYTRFKIPFIRRVMYSGVVAGFFDSAVFVLIGISPLGLNFVPWNLVGYAILGQWVTKVLMQLVVAGGIKQLFTKLEIYEPNISDINREEKTA
ncbi:VUT family protein [Virgibacillus siamensis]|uniref:VUT family protein n=1 Tax=Virgibacillus siamensis TaxID=480071 RepID=UPI0031D5AA62